MGTFFGSKACYRASGGDSGTCLSDSFSSLWTHLKANNCELPSNAAQGVHLLDLGSRRLRYAVTSGLWAIEFEDRDVGDAWDCFAVQLEDGSLRTGWHSRNRISDCEPAPWLAACCELTLYEEVTPKQYPDFMSLVIAFAGAGIPSISNTDFDARESYLAEITHLRQVTSEQARKLRDLRNRLQSVRSNSIGLSATEIEEETSPATLADLSDWAVDNADRITILPRAIGESKKSDYQNVNLFYSALELLADTYRLVKLGEMPRELLKQRSNELGLEIGGSIDQGRAGTAGDEYFVRYGGRRRFLDQHLAHGSSRETRFCLRIYYFWDDLGEKVVVGSCPGHLSNKFT